MTQQLDGALADFAEVMLGQGVPTMKPAPPRAPARKGARKGAEEE